MGTVHPLETAVKWVMQPNMSLKSDVPCITLRARSIAFNVAFMDHAKFSVGDTAEVFIDESERAIGIKFSKTPSDTGYKITPDGGGKSRVVTPDHCNSLVACQLVSLNPLFADLVGTKYAKIPVNADNEKMWIARALPTWQYRTEDRKPKTGEVGVYRYLLDGEVVYIGQGEISSRILDSSRRDWEYDAIEYLLSDAPTAIKTEAIMLATHKDLYGRLPFYNKVLGRKAA